MIEFDSKQSILSNRELFLVALFCGHETSEKLWYEGQDYYKVMHNAGVMGDCTEVVA